MIKKFLYYLLVPISYLHYFFKQSTYGSEIPKPFLSERVYKFSIKRSITINVIYDSQLYPVYPGFFKKHNRSRVWEFKKIPVHNNYQSRLLNKYYRKIYKNIILFYVNGYYNHPFTGIVTDVIDSYQMIVVTGDLLNLTRNYNSYISPIQASDNKSFMRLDLRDSGTVIMGYYMRK